jgi:hypothetical protein
LQEFAPQQSRCCIFRPVSGFRCNPEAVGDLFAVSWPAQGVFSRANLPDARTLLVIAFELGTAPTLAADNCFALAKSNWAPLPSD